MRWLDNITDSVDMSLSCLLHAFLHSSPCLSVYTIPLYKLASLFIEWMMYRNEMRYIINTQTHTPRFLMSVFSFSFFFEKKAIKILSQHAYHKAD